MKTIRVAFYLCLVIIGFTMIITSCDKDNDDDNNNNTPPLASFTKDPSSGTISTIFTFDASSCKDNEDPLSALEVRWDWENDGSWDENYTTVKTASHQYASNGSYTVKIEVKDLGGLTNSATKTFIVGDQKGTFLDSRDSLIYNWVTIGRQTWMSENLAYLPSVRPSILGSVSLPHYYVYGYEGTSVKEAIATSNYQTYGVLYNWFAAMDGMLSSNSNPSGVQGICPKGWHLPSDAEWKELELYLGISQNEIDNTHWRGTNEGGKLKEVGTSHWKTPNYGANNESGFTMLPSGARVVFGHFLNNENYAYVWSSTKDTSLYAWFRFFGYSQSRVYRYINYMENGHCIRCVKD